MSGLELPAAGAVVAAVKFTYDAVRDMRASNGASARTFTEHMKDELESQLKNTPSGSGNRDYGCGALEVMWLISTGPVMNWISMGPVMNWISTGLVMNWISTGNIGRASVTVLPSGVHVCSCGHQDGWDKRICPHFWNTPTNKKGLCGGTLISPRGDYVFTDRSLAKVAAALRDCLDHANKKGKGKAAVVLQSKWCCGRCATEYASELEIPYVVA
ncbi:hypothetical protein GGF32_006191 [Allomyces javanicus]|nr:hypothetical protein GGF32_006191 [Allomyces javanicus]